MARASKLSRRPTCDPAGAALIAAATPLIVGGAVVLALAWAARQPRIRAWARSLLGSRASMLRESMRGYALGERSFSALRKSIVGSAKGAVVRVLGPPRTAMLGRDGGMRTMSIWRADTWYYPLDRRRKSVMAIRFEGNVARDVEHIGVPGAIAD